MSKKEYTDFDHSDVYEREVFPLLKKAFDILNTHKISHHFAVCVSCSDKGFNVRGSTALYGEDSTPMAMYAAHDVIDRPDIAPAICKLIELAKETGVKIEVLGTAPEKPVQIH